MAPTPLNLQDATFLHVETNDYPTHVAGLQIFQLPGRDPDFVNRLVPQLMQSAPAPFWRRTLAPGRLGTLLTPEWVEADEVDLDFHVRRIALPQPGAQAQLERVVERLHARVLDRRRPLWECYFIEGLSGNRFAVYTKMHHALVDGMAGVWLAMAAVSDDPSAPATAPWSIDMPTPAPRPAPSLGDRLRGATRTLADLGTLNARQGLDWAGRLLGSHERADLPFAAPFVPFNGKVDGQRRFATRSLPMARVKAVSKATGATLNDLVLALVGTALRAWLQEQDTLPERALIASCPVSVRAGDGFGNNLSALLADLATDETDPLARLRRVMDSTGRGKRSIAGLSSGGAQGWALAMGLAGLAPALVNEGRTLPPLANLVVSNVPGPREPRYYAGAEMVGYYPVSILTHGQGLNITLLSRAGAVDFGFTGARELVQDLGRLGDALEAALTTYENAVEADLSQRTEALAGRPAAPTPASSDGSSAASTAASEDDASRVA